MWNESQVSITVFLIICNSIFAVFLNYMYIFSNNFINLIIFVADSKGEKDWTWMW